MSINSVVRLCLAGRGRNRLHKGETRAAPSVAGDKEVRLENASRPMVLAFVQLPPPMHGAAAVNREVVVSPLLNRSYRIITVPIQLSKSIQDINAIGVKKWLTLIRNIVIAAKCVVREGRPSLVYFALPPHGGGFYANLPLIALVKLFRTPLLYHFHGKGVRVAAENGFYRKLFAWAMAGAHVILLSERLYCDVSALLGREQIFFLPNALIASPMCTESGRRDGRHIVFLSNLIEAKGPLVLLDALKLLKRRGIEFRASFAGEPRGNITRESFCAAVATRCLTGTVQYLGSVAAKGKQDLLRSADILAFPTHYNNEAFPLVVLEAMGAAVAVVATPEGAIPDLVRDGETGILVPHDDSEMLADALKRLLDDPALCRRMGERGHEVVTREYSSDAFHQRMKDIWEAVISIHEPS